MHSRATAQVICTVSPPRPLADMPKSLRTRTTTQEIWMETTKYIAQSKNILVDFAQKAPSFAFSCFAARGPLMERPRAKMKPRMDSKRYPITI